MNNVKKFLLALSIILTMWGIGILIDKQEDTNMLLLETSIDRETRLEKLIEEQQETNELLKEMIIEIRKEHSVNKDVAPLTEQEKEQIHEAISQ